MHHKDETEQCVVTLEMPTSAIERFNNDPEFRERFIWAMRAQGVNILDVQTHPSVPTKGKDK